MTAGVSASLYIHFVLLVVQVVNECPTTLPLTVLPQRNFVAHLSSAEVRF